VIVAERDARRAADGLLQLAATIPEDQKVELRRGRDVLCGDCGISSSIFDRCAWCDGHATPLERKPR
jgi:hypothetical protein